jgi:aminotransferase
MARDSLNKGNTLQTQERRAERLKNISGSGIRCLFELNQSKHDLANLGIGEPDFSPPKHVIEAAIQALKDGKTRYTPSNGIPELREALARKYSHEYGLSYDPDNEIIVTVGATEAVAIALMTLVNPGDDVLLPDPGFVCYKPAILLAGGNPVPIPMKLKDGFKPDLEAVTSLITERSRVIIINSPNNPTGSVMTCDELKTLGKIALENDLIVISDEVYEKITYDQTKHHCFATFHDQRERTIVVNSFSKTYAMTGLRVGYALGPKELISSMTLAQQFVVASVNGPAQYAATAALEGDQKFITNMVSEFDRRRRLISKGLNGTKGFRCNLPEGAFYVFPNIEDFGTNSLDFSQFLAKDARVVTTPGSAFGRHGEGFLRLSYATSSENINNALHRIEKATQKLRG